MRHMPSADEDWDDEEWDDEEWDDNSDSGTKIIVFTNLRIAIGVSLVILLLVSSMIFTNFGFYSGAGTLTLLIDVNEGKDENDVTFTFSVFAASPAFGKLAKEGSYKVIVTPSSVEYYDSPIQVSQGSFSLDDSGKTSVSISYSDLFEMNGNYMVEIELGGQKATDSVTLNKFADSALFDLVLFDGSEPIDKDSEGIITNLHFFSEILNKEDSSSGESIMVVPSVSGQITVYHSEEIFDSGKGEEYWDNDDSRDPLLVEVIDFEFSGDQMKLTYQSGNIEDGAAFNPILFDIDEIYGAEGSGDYALTIEFTNNLGTDNSPKSGQSIWKWFHICDVKDGACDGNN